MHLALGPSLVQRPRFHSVAVLVALALLLQLPLVLVALLVGHLAREQHRVVALALLSEQPQLLSRDRPPKPAEHVADILTGTRLCDQARASVGDLAREHAAAKGKIPVTFYWRLQQRSTNLGHALELPIHGQPHRVAVALCHDGVPAAGVPR